MNTLKIAVLWARFGPYHLARLRGAVDVANRSGGAILPIQVAGTDSVYKWHTVATEAFGGVTLFPHETYEDIPHWEMRERLVQTLDEFDCSVVVVNGWGTPEARAGIKWRCRAPRRRAVLMSETGRDDRPRKPWKEWFKRRLVARCDVALVGGRLQVEYLHSLGFGRDRMFMGYDVVDNAYFEAGSEAARANGGELRRRKGLPESYFLACARFLERKNLDGLLHAYGRYQRYAGDRCWGLVILGGGEEEHHLHDIERNLSLNNVKWPGFVQYDELPIYYGLASAFIHPAKSEAWGLVVNEAGASGLPLIVSRRVGSAFELLRDGVNGYSFDPFDVESMASAMSKVARMDQEARCHLGEHSKRIVAKWSPERFGEQLMQATKLAVSLPDH